MPKGFQKGHKINVGRKWKMSEESRERVSEAHKGLKYSNRKSPNPLTKEHRKKISLNNSRYWLGKKRSEETKIKLSQYRGEKASGWKGGISFEQYTPKWINSLKEAIRKRDDYTCQMCNVLENGRKHSVHHIDYNKKNCEINNLITLCLRCHGKTNFNREDWIKVFIHKFKNEEDVYREAYGN